MVWSVFTTASSSSSVFMLDNDRGIFIDVDSLIFTSTHRQSPPSCSSSTRLPVICNPVDLSELHGRYANGSGRSIRWARTWPTDRSACSGTSVVYSELWVVEIVQLGESRPLLDLAQLVRHGELGLERVGLETECHHFGVEPEFWDQNRRFGLWLDHQRLVARFKRVQVLFERLDGVGDAVKQFVDEELVRNGRLDESNRDFHGDSYFCARVLDREQSLPLLVLLDLEHDFLHNGRGGRDGGLLQKHTDVEIVGQHQLEVEIVKQKNELRRRIADLGKVEKIFGNDVGQAQTGRVRSNDGFQGGELDFHGDGLNGQETVLNDDICVWTELSKSNGGCGFHRKGRYVAMERFMAEVYFGSRNMESEQMSL
ncbi:hypothetical protein OGAPHI_003039 [Ogataea philodendri]|uniref:Uncharacterized protein n=1 Tax=Ogataea philodendri TaxID=1378263 RepID=A0A9P8P9C1_9ASCO|nr:uncharacterized protein OGAPHI_003039 [Ogataea philodendri]KAH3667390.1 hypothetical protein OGAPHI_003039 [Ogataea philodendri]